MNVRSHRAIEIPAREETISCFAASDSLALTFDGVESVSNDGIALQSVWNRGRGGSGGLIINEQYCPCIRVVTGLSSEIRTLFTATHSSKWPRSVNVPSNRPEGGNLPLESKTNKINHNHRSVWFHFYFCPCFVSCQLIRVFNSLKKQVILTTLSMIRITCHSALSDPSIAGYLRVAFYPPASGYLNTLSPSRYSLGICFLSALKFTICSCELVRSHFKF